MSRRAFYDLISLHGGIRIECGLPSCDWSHDEMFDRGDVADTVIAIDRCDERIAEHFEEMHPK